MVSSGPIIDTLITQFATPEALIDCYYYSMKHGNIDQIVACLGLKFATEINYEKLPGINYRIISKNKFQDSIYTYTLNDKGQFESIWVFPEIYLVTQDSCDFVSGHSHSYYWIGKRDSSWLIMQHSSEIEDQMQEAELEGAESATRKMDSIQNAKSSLK